MIILLNLNISEFECHDSCSYFNTLLYKLFFNTYRQITKIWDWAEYDNIL